MGNNMVNKRSKVHNRTVLTDNEISILEAKTGLSRQEIQAWHSQFLQDNPSGYIDRKHFDKIFKELFADENPGQSADLAFQVFDINKTGKVTFSEFLIATAVPKTDKFCPAVRAELERIFNVYADNGESDHIDREDLQRFLEAMANCEGLDPTRVRNEIRRFLNEHESGSHSNADASPKKFFTRQESIEFILSRPF